MAYPVDIVVPVWNRPVETRACLAALVEGTPHARIIMVNYGSERETERILHEFAEALDDRAILVSTERNVGRVSALNHGIGLCTAPLVAIVQEDVRVGRNWLGPLEGVMANQPDAGLAIPFRGDKLRQVGNAPHRWYEVDHGSFGAMLLRRELCTSIGYLDEAMDGGVWCLRDYSRRAVKAGFRTVCVADAKLDFAEPALLGSLARREERTRMGEQVYRQRWGEQQRFSLALVGPASCGALPGLLPSVLMAARQGHDITILADKSVASELVGQGDYLHHAAIAVEKLPAFFTMRALKKRLEQLSFSFPAQTIVTCLTGEGSHLAGRSPQAFVELIEEYHRRYYRVEGEADAGCC
jgi:hypothetical protein